MPFCRDTTEFLQILGRGSCTVDDIECIGSSDLTVDKRKTGGIGNPKVYEFCICKVNGVFFPVIDHTISSESVSYAIVFHGVVRVHQHCEVDINTQDGFVELFC